MWFSRSPPAGSLDQHVTIFPIFTVPKDKMAVFKVSDAFLSQRYQTANAKRLTPNP